MNVKSLRDGNDIAISKSLIGELPPGVDYAIFADGKNISSDDFRITLDHGEKFVFKVLAGSSDFVQSKLDEVKNAANVFSIKNK